MVRDNNSYWVVETFSEFFEVIFLICRPEHLVHFETHSSLQKEKRRRCPGFDQVELIELIWESQNIVNNYIGENIAYTRRLGNVRRHIMFRHRSSIFLTQMATKWGTDRKLPKTYISFNKQPMVYKKATLDKTN